MRIGIDIRPLQCGSRERGIGYYIRGLLEGLSGLETNDSYVLVTIPGRAIANETWNNLNAEFCPIPLEPPGWQWVEPIRYLRWLNPAHALKRGMRYDIMLRRRVDMFHLARAARKQRLDVLHLTSVFELEFYANADTGFPCPVLQTVYDMIPEVFPDFNRYASWDYKYGRAMGRRSLELTNGPIVAISESARADTERVLPRTQGRIATVYCGVGEHFVPQDTVQIDRVLATSGLCRWQYFLTNGSVDWRKNLKTVITAFSEVYRADANLKLVVPGRMTDEDKAQISQWADAANLTHDAIVCPGFVADEDLPAFYSGAAALAFPSLYEGFGLPVAEAMRCGCPVITARNSSLMEVGGDVALYIDNAEDAHALAAAMMAVLKDPELSNSRRSAGIRWSEQFNWRAVALQYRSHYAAAALRGGRNQQ